jgi:hypothetical protein
MSEEKFPLSFDISMEVGRPFIAYTTNNKRVILQSESLVNAHGDVVYYTEVVVDPDPTEEEIFKVELANPQEERQIAWGFRDDCIKGDTVGGSHFRQEGS